jgi:hypothetical protein
MHVYNYRIFDRYNREVVSLAVLADVEPDWRPTHYSYGRWGGRTMTEFVTFKLLDYAPHWQALEVHPNPFALVVLAHLKTLETRRSPANRQAWKVRLIRKLYERGLAKEDIRQLFRFIDWIMELPKPLKQLFWQEITQHQEETQMPYITTPEQLAREEIYTEGIEMALEIKFGAEGLKLLPEIRDLDHEMLQRVFRAIKTARTPDSLRRIWASSGSEPPSSTGTQEEFKPFLTTPECLGLEKGLLKGIEVSLAIRFGEEGLKLMPEIRELPDHEVMQTVLEAIPNVHTPEELRRIWAS